MNKSRRKALQNIASKLSEIAEGLSIIKEEEEDAYQNMPEYIQSSERGDNMQNCIDRLDDIIYNISDCQESILNIVEE